MFLSEKVRIFRTQAQKENCLVSKRSEFRLKSVVSNLDVRTWSFDREDRRKAFLELVNSPDIHIGNYVPFIELLQILGIRKAFLLRIKYDNTVKFHSYDKVNSIMYQDQEVLIDNVKYSQAQSLKIGGSSKHSNLESDTVNLMVPNNSVNFEMEAGCEDQEIKDHTIIESYNKMKLHLQRLIPVAIEKDNLENELVKMSETIKDLTKVISYQDNEINRLINILQSNQETMVRQDKSKTKNDFCQTVPSTNNNDQMCLHMISVNSHDKNQQLYFYQLQISLNQERKNFNKLLKLLRIEQETRKNIQQELNKQLRKATELAVERDLLRKTLQYNEKTVQRYMLESETEKEKAKLLEHSLTVLEQQLERIEKSLQADIENCKTLQSQQMVDRIQKHIKDSKKLNLKLLTRNRLETCYVPSRSDTELYKPYSSASKILLAKRDITRTFHCEDDDEEDEEMKLCLDRIYKNRNAQYAYRRRKPTIRSNSLSRCVMKRTSVILDKSEPESDGKLCDTTSSKINIHNEMYTTIAPDIKELYKSKPQQLEMQEFSTERVMSKVSLGKTRAKDNSYDSEITLLGLRNSRSSTGARKNSTIRKQKDSDKRIPSKHKSDTRRKPYLSTFYPKSLQLPSDRKKAEASQSERRKDLKIKTPKSSRTKVGETGLLDKFYPKDKKSTSSGGLKTPRKSASVVLPIQRFVSSCDLEIHTRLARTRARLQEIYDKYSDCKNEFTRKSKTFILDTCSSTRALPIQESHHICTPIESYRDLSRNHKTKFSTSQKQFVTPSTIQNSYYQTCVTEAIQPCGGGGQTKYLAVYSGDSVGAPAMSKFVDNKLDPQKTVTPARVTEKHLVCSSKHSLKTMKYKDDITDSFYRDVNIDINYKYDDRSASKDKYHTTDTYTQRTPVYSNKDLYKKYATGGKEYYQTSSRDKLFTPKQNYLFEKPSYRQLSNYESYYKTGTSVTDFQKENKKPLKYSDVVGKSDIGNHTKYIKNKPARSSPKKTKKKIQFDNNRAKQYGYELPDSYKYPRQDREDYSLPEKENMHTFRIDGGKNFCTVCDSKLEIKNNSTSALSPSYKSLGELGKTNVSYTVKDWEQTTPFDQKNSNLYKDMFTRNGETSDQSFYRIHKRNPSRYQTGRDQVYHRQGTPDLYKARTVIKHQEPQRATTVKESYFKRPLDPYNQPDITTVRGQISAYSAIKPPNLTTSEYTEYLKAKYARRANAFTY